MGFNYMAYGWGHGFWTILLWPLIVWSIIWKGMALWKSARVGNKGWFVALLILNTAGILDILYLYVFSKKTNSVSERAK